MEVFHINRFEATHILWALSSFFLTHIVATAIYNLFFHPLRKYPGPKYAAINGLVYWIVAAQGDIVTWVQKIHREYGDVVRIGPNRLSYTNPQAWKDIYGPRVGHRKANSKDVMFYAFSDKALKAQENLISAYVDQLISNIRHEASSNGVAQLDMVRMYNCTTFDIMGDLCFGESLGLLKNSEYSPWLKVVFSSIKAGGVSQFLLEYPTLGRLTQSLMPKSLAEKAQINFRHSADRVDKRLAKDSDKPDIWNLVLQREERLTLRQIGLTFYLLTNQDKLKKLVDEVRGLESEDQLNLNNLPRLKYMAACFEEGLRVYPPVPIGLPREIPEGGNTILGEWLPAKTRVSVHQWSTYRSPQNFKDPDSFVPERWLPGSGYDDDKKDALNPFSLGPRNCIGKKYG
ncbi:putative cytochrome p450 protein [Neofusicoccum parvum UCRNP2]|uniref:Putative cytochrome p450 protein n=1 Tax=Botryosphaeria parva (strain UCR-NP2) TaxID=1287680 RepID=R1GBP7_BOTPV|nr:putative cytochrome p450 protein [Neofusicoccum parvum UCRNP2]